MIKNKLFKQIFSFIIVVVSIASVRFVGAQDFGADPVSTGLDGILATGDPRTIAGRIINFILGFLGIIALGLVVYAGFLWMTSAGEEEKISRAKKLLLNAIVGLAIILASWAIATFIITRLSGAVSGTGGYGCTSGETRSCGCGGTMYCTDEAWTGCIGFDCGGGPGPTTCSTAADVCQPNNDICSDDDYCDSECICRPLGSGGDSCNNNFGSSICSANDDLCGEFLTCDTESCVCTGPPVITGISPVGGFCQNSPSQACILDSDCNESTCDKSTPNGNAGNFITILGKNFGEYQEGLSLVHFVGDSVTIGRNPSELNGACVNFWSDKQIIIAVPNGVTNGPIKVIREDGIEDLSNNDFGPLLPNFTANSIVRPGLCSLNPSSGELNALVTYQGINLYSGQAYFGNYQSNVAALNSTFGASGFSGVANIPNIVNGEASSFVISNLGGNNQASNYLNFVKETDPKDSPYIMSFTPTEGRSGQYITIIGDGFGAARGNSKVYFGDVEANYDFPPICANSVWSNNQIIVKVPEGLTESSYLLKISLGGVVIDTQNLTPNVFRIDDSLSLKTSLCKIEPSQGSISTPVKVYGEYFGNTGSIGLVRFNDNKDDEGLIKKENGADIIEAEVPADAITGPVTVIKAGDSGNNLNFAVGSCSSDENCPGQKCCPANTYKSGRCVNALIDCLIDIPNSVFEWKFNTGYDNPDDQESCATIANYYGACQTGYLCPNVPGVCSPYAGGNSKVVGNCDYSCASVDGCASILGGNSNCSYNSDINKCVYNSYVCDLPTKQNFTIENQEFSFDVTCNQDGNWQLTTSTSCPDGWERGVNNICVNLSSSCSDCNSGLACAQVGAEGRCVSSSICPAGSECQAGGSPENSGECIATDEASCDCCCRVDFANQDCCAPLNCSGACGNDPTGEVYGLCSGCAAVGTTQAEHDSACNCTGHSGQYCSITSDRPEGVCTDCTGLTSLEACNSASSCCFDHTNNRCQGGSKIIDGENAGYCAYYDCDNSELEKCSPPDEPKISGQFNNYATCVDSCGDNGGAGLQCNTGMATQTCNFNICSFPAMSCLTSSGAAATNITDCGTCCCDPSVPEACQTEEAPNLYCKPDQGSCSGSARGLCCGCENDGQCGNSETTGCGINTCCQARPEVISTLPESGADNVCRNAAIQVEFNQLMDVDSFDNNVILFKEMPAGSGTCPPGTFVYNAEQVFKSKSANRLSSLFSGIKNIWYSIFSPLNSKEQTVLASPPDINKLYCSTPIRVSGEHMFNEAASFSILTISPEALLDAGTNYFVVIKGDESLNSQLGVLSVEAIGFNGKGLDLGDGYTEGEEYTFNSNSYKNSHIIQFTTLRDSEINAGVCALDQIELRPVSYLFNTTQSNLDENDLNPDDKTFDTKNDKDKLFVAWPYSADRQIIQPVTGYFWRWNFALTDTGVVSQVAVNNLKANSAFIEAKDGVTDGRTVLSATVEMDDFLNSDANPSPDCVCTTDTCPENCRNAFSVGNQLSGMSNIYVFICNNPWPPIKADGTWSPWQDNCDSSVSPGCNIFNYSFYYCRDSDLPGTFDDLPAINPQAVILGKSSVLACSSDGSTCSDIDAVCGQDRNGDGQADGVCVWGVLKESYFFRDTPVYPAQINTLVNKQIGSQVEITWSSDRDQVTAYKIYFGETGKAISNFIEVSASSDACTIVADKYECLYLVSKLNNNQSYTFRISTLSDNRVESALSQESSVVPTDSTPPTTPTNFQAALMLDQKLLRFTWNKSFYSENNAVSHFRLYRGVQPGLYGESFDVDSSVNSIDIPLSKLVDINNYYALSALDASKNESGKTNEILVVKPAIALE